MSGHSKWAQIKRQKGVADIKRGQAFTKIANAITIVVKQAGGVGNPDQNFKLRLAVEKARSLNMPKENIERAIERGKGKVGGLDMQEMVYEGFGPENVAVIVEAVTDNKQRTASLIKNLFEKGGGSLGTPGTVSYLFQIKGQITLAKNSRSIDEIFLKAADVGADDVEEVGSEVLVYTKPEELAKVRSALSQEFPIVSSELTRVPTVSVPITTQESASKILGFVERLEELDDVQKVYANFDIPDEYIGKA